MSAYTELKTTNEFLAFMKGMYFPPMDKVAEIDLPEVQVIAVTGKGSPESENFQQAIAALYGIGYGLKMGFKFGKIPKPAGYFDFKMPPLEGLWWQKGGFGTGSKEDWEWKVMIMLPAFISTNAFEVAKKQAIEKHPEIPYKSVELEKFAEGKSLQITHMGPYAQEEATVTKIMDYAKQNGLEIHGKHHEIYMNDPRRVTPEKIKTVLRYPVK